MWFSVGYVCIAAYGLSQAGIDRGREIRASSYYQTITEDKNKTGQGHDRTIIKPISSTTSFKCFSRYIKRRQFYFRALANIGVTFMSAEKHENFSRLKPPTESASQNNITHRIVYRYCLNPDNSCSN